jgi:sec-independent protein translocase protein TatA
MLLQYCTIHFPLANLFGMDPMNWAFIAVLALLIFGKRLPEVGRSLGKGIIEFKKGLAGVEQDIDQAEPQRPAEKVTSQERSAPQASLPQGYKFDPFTGKPVNPEPQMRFDPYTGKPLNEQNIGAQSSSTSNT